jgi:hypothetical protein
MVRILGAGGDSWLGRWRRPIRPPVGVMNAPASFGGIVPPRSLLRALSAILATRALRTGGSSPQREADSTVESWQHTRVHVPARRVVTSERTGLARRLGPHCGRARALSLRRVSRSPAWGEGPRVRRALAAMDGAERPEQGRRRHGCRRLTLGRPSPHTGDRITRRQRKHDESPPTPDRSPATNARPIARRQRQSRRAAASEMAAALRETAKSVARENPRYLAFSARGARPRLSSRSATR